MADGWGMTSEGGGATVGDHFYTPDLPGQDAGELGGPLYFDFSTGTNRNNVTIEGYLYLKP